MAENISVIKCQGCGADMVYSPEKGMMYCPYCDTTRIVLKSIALKRNFFQEWQLGKVDSSTAEYECPNCSGQIMLENFQTALSCPFCGATNIAKKESFAGLKPDAILPFIFSQEKALNAGKTWIKKRVFAPSKLKKTFDAEHFKGVYIPVFIFDSNTSSSYKGRLGERYTVTVRDRKGNVRTETRIRWFNVSGNLYKLFQDMIIEASTQVTQKELGKLLPFDLISSEEYKREYLAGFTAERYSTSLDDSFKAAKSQMEAEIRKAVLNQYKADVVDYLNISTNYTKVDFQYTLLPVWVCGYKYREKTYHFIVNGRTGKSTGKAPVSGGKISAVVLAGIGLIAALIYLVFTYLIT